MEPFQKEISMGLPERIRNLYEQLKVDMEKYI